MHALVVPPFVRVIHFAGVGVIGGAEEVELGQIVSVAEMVHDASVEPGSAIGDVGVPMHVAPEQSIGLTIHFPLVAVEGRALGGFVRVRVLKLLLQPWQRRRRGIGKLGKARGGRPA